MKSTKKIKKRFGKYFFETEEDEMIYNIYKKLGNLDYNNYISELEDELNDLLLIKDTVSFDQYEYDNKLEKLVDELDNFFDDFDYDVNEVRSLSNTCSMYEISFDNFSTLTSLTKEEFIYFFKRGNLNSLIFNVVINLRYDRYIKTKLGLTPVASYKGNSGNINTYIYIPEESIIKQRKPRSKK